FQRLSIESGTLVQLREATRTRDMLVKQHRQLANQLRAALESYYPQVLALCEGADEPWFWELLKLAPGPEAGTRLSRKRVETLLKRRRITTVNSEKVLACLRARPLSVAEGAAEERA